MINLTVSLKSNIPIYEQIYDQIAAQILNGKLKPDEILPSIRNVASELSISVITVKNAWEQLAANGFIYTVEGKGCFVAHVDDKLAERKLSIAAERLKNDLEYYRGLGISLSELKKLIDENY